MVVGGAGMDGGRRRFGSLEVPRASREGGRAAADSKRREMSQREARWPRAGGTGDV